MADPAEKKENKKGIFFILFAALALVGGGAYLWHLSTLNALPSLSIQRYGDGGYMFKINDKPFLVKGFCYNPVPVGKDFEYDFWSDPGKPWLTDGKLMKEAGVNAVRIYRVGHNPGATKKAIGDLHTKFGIRTFIGDYLGFWDWPQANYSSATFQKKMTEQVLNNVRQFKTEAGVIGWILGNENNYSFDRNIRNWSSDEIDKLADPEKMWEARARIYYRFVNDIAKEVKKIDPTRPVIMGLGEIKSLHIAAQETPDIDVLGVIAYRGASFGNLFRQIKQTYDKPVLMIEFGADRFNAYTREEDQQSQSRFVELQWKDIERNSVIKTGSGNAIGGLVFEWSDEWWKGNESLAHTWSIHDQTAQWSHSAYYYDYEAPGRMNINEEWWGVVSLTPSSQELQGAVDKRTPTRTYFILKELWNKETTSVADTGVRQQTTPTPPDATSTKLSTPVVTPSTSGGTGGSSVTPPTASVKAADKTPTITIDPASLPGSGVPSTGLGLAVSPSGGYTWTLGGAPFWAKGVAYSAGPLADPSSAAFWQNPARPWVADADAMKKAGANSIRLYTTPDALSGTVLAIQDFYSRGIYTFLGHDLGFWTRPLSDYRDPAVRAAISGEVLQMVEAGKKQPGILGWILGNENHSSFEGPLTPDKQEQAQAYFDFVNTLAADIKKIDPTRPVIMGLGENTQYADLIYKATPSVDAIGLISYRGQDFGNTIDTYAAGIHKPVLVLEYGADSYNALTGAEDEPAQARYLESLWKDLRRNTTMDTPAGHAVGGFLYEWVDQWWRADANNPANWKVHNTEAQWSSAAYAYDYSTADKLNVNEEWFGVYKLVPDAQNPGQLVTAPKLALTGLQGLWQQPPTLAAASLGIAPMTGDGAALPSINIPAASESPVSTPAVSSPTPAAAPASSVIRIVQNPSGGAAFAAAGETLWTKGVVYSLTPIGQGPAFDFLADTTSPWGQDGSLMAAAGVNSVLTYVSPSNLPGAQSMAADLFKNHKIWTFAALDPGLLTSATIPDYADPAVKAKITADALAAVEGLKDSKGLAAWVIANRSAFVKEDPALSQSMQEAYYTFLNELVQKIKAADPSHPVVVEVLGRKNLKLISGLLPDADAVGIYGREGAWAWRPVFDAFRADFTQPVLVLAYGADSYNMQTGKTDEEAQSWMIQSQWNAIDPQTTHLTPDGRVLGGFVYEWTDSWWKADPSNPSNWTVQDKSAQGSSPAYPADFDPSGQNNVNEEWFGIFKLKPAAPGTALPIRTPKKVYETLQGMWSPSRDVCPS